jgi:hypothetical protein
VSSKVVIAFIIGVAFGFVMGITLVKKDMPLYTDTSVLEEARESVDGSTNSLREGMKNMLP